MTYYTHTKKELLQLGIRENELAIYTGTRNSQEPNGLSPNGSRENVTVFIWEYGQAWEVDGCFRPDGAGLDILEVRPGKEKYAFLRDCASGYIRQISGPARPITVVNLGAIPLRVDTFLGKFIVYGGSGLRLDENAPQREKKMVLLTFDGEFRRLLRSAEIWDGISWRQLNIRADPHAAGEDRCFAVLDGSAIVQYLEVIGDQEIFVMDSPEPDPDYEIYVTAEPGYPIMLRFDRSDYQDGRVVHRGRTIECSRGEPVIYDLQKFRETLTQDAVWQCTAGLPGVPDILKLPDLTEETLLPNDKLREFLESEDKLGEQPLSSENFQFPLGCLASAHPLECKASSLFKHTKVNGDSEKADMESQGENHE